MKQEFKLLAAIIRDYTPQSYDYKPAYNAGPQAKQADYDMVEVIPVSDPNSSTMAQRIMQYQAAFQMATSAPEIYDLPYLHRQMIEVLGVKNAEKIIPVEDDLKPVDPISENMAIQNSKPVKAFIFQDHESHITAHTSFIQDPMIAQQMGQNPKAQQMNASLQAHIAEHLGYAYRKQIEDRMGMQLPAPDAKMPPEMEVEVSRLVAQAAQQLLQIHKTQASQQEALAAAKDPIVQMQQQELQIKQADMQRKTQKDQSDAQIAQAKMQIEVERMKVDAQKAAAEIQLKSMQVVKPQGGKR
jgi:hypothetical protein